jgi:hypothetical protein
MVVSRARTWVLLTRIPINGFLDLCELLWCPVENRLWKKAFRYVALNRLASGFKGVSPRHFVLRLGSGNFD